MDYEDLGIAQLVPSIPSLGSVSRCLLLLSPLSIAIDAQLYSAEAVLRTSQQSLFEHRRMFAPMDAT